jgi:hypothetical protein
MSGLQLTSDAGRAAISGPVAGQAAFGGRGLFARHRRAPPPAVLAG